MATQQSKELFEQNLELFRQRAPTLYDLAKSYQPEAALITTEEGCVDLSVGESLVFGGRYDALVGEMLENYWRQPSRIALTPPNPEQGDGDAGQFVGDLLRRCEQGNIALGDSLTPAGGYFLLIFGVGLGAHIDPLVERSGCQTLVLVEPSFEYVYHSMSTYEWDALFRSFDANSRTLQMVFDSDVTKACMGIKWSLRESNVCALDGAYYFKFGDMPAINEILSRMGNELMGVSDDLGCYVDERLMVLNSHANLGSAEARIYKTPGERELPLPVFLVGSGPSLDDAIEVIKENQDNAVIVSVGTALQPLLNNGITPDFQVESENYYPDFNAIRDFLKSRPETDDIHLIAAVTCPGEFVNSYGSSTLYFRAGQTPNHLFRPPESAILVGGSPSVGNAGMSFALWSGFRAFYLFGMDLGARNPERHHADGSYGIVYEEFDIEMPANFGGVAYTTTIFFKTLVAVREAVQAFAQGRRFFNCSDGCLIEGVEPVRPGELTLDPPAADKSEVVRQLIADAEPYDRRRFEERLAESDLVSQIGKLTGQTANLIAETTDFAGNGYLKRLYGLYANEEDPKRAPARMVIRGTIFNMLIAIRYFSNRLADRGQATLYRDAVRETFAEAMERLNRKCENDLGGLIPKT
ncbi:MAG: motility associated factor glycosyltransferase family protein [Proteobacteria bacterium]|nr:motility associated factor glycosyltransferase family protein [Pseudomonadota bacterium]